tara:strand:+ start:369 stop:2270 length:1902 start_codon:yes stop_codon:yes gene_type:complete
MATEELIVLLDAKTQKLDAKLKATEARLDGLDGKTKKNDKSLGSLSKTAGVAAGAALRLAKGVLAVSAAITAMTLVAASNRKELELLSRQAKTSTADFQALSFATSQYGINAEQIADISKDIADKIGEFSGAGTGVFQDYADVMKLSKDEAREAAQAFEGLSSQEILGTMVSRMEDASVSGDKMTFVLESMGNDASKLIPLFSNNSKELLTLKERFNGVNDSLQITNTQAEALKEVSTTFDLLKSSSGNAATAISATLAPVMDDFFNDIIEIVPDATQTIIDFINTFLDAENISSVSGVLKEIERAKENIADAEQRSLSSASFQAEYDEAILAGAKNRLTELEAQLVVLEAQEKKLEDVNRLSGGAIGGEEGAVVEGDPIGTGDEIQKIADRFKEEETLLAEKLVREIQLVGANSELKLELEQEFVDNIQAIRDEAREVETDADAKALSDRAKLDQKAGKAKIALERSVSKNAISLLKMVGGENKAAAIVALGIQKATALSANATATFSGAQLAYASQLVPGDPTSPVRGAAAMAHVNSLGAINAGLIVATGLGQAGAITSGGGGAGFSGGGSDDAPRQQSFIPDVDTTSLELTDATESGSNQQTVTFATDTGDELMDVIAKGLEKGRREGRF